MFLVYYRIVDVYLECVKCLWIFHVVQSCTAVMWPYLKMLVTCSTASVWIVTFGIIPPRWLTGNAYELRLKHDCSACVIDKVSHMILVLWLLLINFSVSSPTENKMSCRIWWSCRQMYECAPTYPSFQMVSDVSEWSCGGLSCSQSCLFLTLEEHSGETANTDVQGCTNPRQQVAKFCVVAPNISMESNVGEGRVRAQLSVVEQTLLARQHVSAQCWAIIRSRRRYHMRKLCSLRGGGGVN
jgi:hypothetical protein